MMNRNMILLATLLFIVFIGVYANHFYNGFHFDDSHTIVDNVYIRNIKNIPAFFSHPEMFSASPAHWGLRPMVTTTLAIDYWLGKGLNPFYFHLSTFIWYGLLCVMLYFVYKQLLSNAIKTLDVKYLSLFGVAWYALHTANAETINYIISRSDVLSTFFIVSSFFIYIRWPHLRNKFLYIIPAFIGVFAKETVLVLLIILFFYIVLFEKGLSLRQLLTKEQFPQIFKTIGQLFPLLIVVGITQIYTLSKINAIEGISNPLGPYVLTQSYVWLRYFIAFFLPLNLSADTDWTVIYNPFDERIIIGVSFCIALIWSVFKASEKTETKPIALGLIWFAAALLPTSLAPFAEVTNDHRMFFPFIGLMLSVVTAVAVCLEKYSSVWKKNIFSRSCVIFIALFIIGLNGYGVHQRNKIWKDEETLWLDVTVKSPLNGRGLMNYGLSQMAKGNYSVAEEYFNKASVYLPYYSTLYINIGILKSALNSPQLAEENFKQAISLDPGAFAPYVYYAQFLKDTHRLVEAQQMGEKALAINPSSLFSLNVLTEVYQQLELWNELKEAAKKTLVLLPGDAKALSSLAFAEDKMSFKRGDVSKETKAKTAADYLNQSLYYYNSKDYNSCIEACRQALKIKPDYADAYSNMGAAYNQLKQWDKGADACRKALSINPDHPLAKGNLEWALKQREM